uniref:hypothetical protein n=1 Tax=Celeribacter sp. TaxID=1890673 RepID=UPI003A8D54E8
VDKVGHKLGLTIGAKPCSDGPRRSITKNRKTMQVWEEEYERRAQKAKVSNLQKKLSNPDKRNLSDD